MIVQLIIYALSGQVTCEIIYAVQEVIGQSSNSVNHQSSLPFPLNFVPRLSSNCFIETTPLPPQFHPYGQWVSIKIQPSQK